MYLDTGSKSNENERGRVRPFKGGRTAGYTGWWRRHVMSSSVSNSRCCVKARARMHGGEGEGEVRTSLSSLASVVASWVASCHESHCHVVADSSMRVRVKASSSLREGGWARRHYRRVTDRKGEGGCVGRPRQRAPHHADVVASSDA